MKQWCQRNWKILLVPLILGFAGMTWTIGGSWLSKPPVTKQDTIPHVKQSNKIDTGSHNIQQNLNGNGNTQIGSIQGSGNNINSPLTKKTIINNYNKPNKADTIPKQTIVNNNGIINNGIINGGIGNTYSQIKASPEDLEWCVSQIEKIKKDSNITSNKVALYLLQGSNGSYIYNQLKEYLHTRGYHLETDAMVFNYDVKGLKVQAEYDKTPDRIESYIAIYIGFIEMRNN